jgi:hypothetical protein
MSTALARRLNRVEIDHFTEACRDFGPWFLGLASDPATASRDRAILIAVGAPADGTLAEISAWADAQEPPSPRYAALAVVIDLLLEDPADHAAIRAALAALAPHIGRCATDPPLTILTTVRAGMTRTGQGDWAW